MGLAVTVTEDVFAAVLEPKDQGSGVQEVMAKEGGLARFVDHTITGNTDRVSVDYGKIFAATGKRVEYSANRLTHIPADMLSHDNENGMEAGGPDQTEGPGGSNRPDLDILEAFSPEYLLALEGVGQGLEALLANPQLSSEAMQELNELLTQLVEVKNLMELSAEPNAPAQVIERLEQKLEQLSETVQSFKSTLESVGIKLPPALGDFALDLMQEAADIAPVKPAVRAAISQARKSLGRTNPPLQRMALSAMIMGGKGVKSAIAQKLADIDPANENNDIDLQNKSEVTTSKTTPSVKAESAAPTGQKPSSPSTPTNGGTTINPAVAVTSVETASPPVTQPSSGGDTSTPAQPSESIQAKPAEASQTVESPADTSPTGNEAITATADPVTSVQETAPTPEVTGIDSTAPAPVVADDGPIQPSIQDPVESPTPDIAPEAAQAPPPTRDQDPIPVAQNPTVPVGDGDTPEVAPTTPTEAEPVTNDPDIAADPTGNPAPTAEEGDPSAGPTDGADGPDICGGGGKGPCRCSEFEKIARGEAPDTRTEADFIAHYGEEAYHDMGGAENIRRMEADDINLAKKLEEMSGGQRGDSDAYKQAFSAMLKAAKAPGTRTGTFQKACDCGLDHSKAADLGVQAQILTHINIANLKPSV